MFSNPKATNVLDYNVRVYLGKEGDGIGSTEVESALHTQTSKTSNKPCLLERSFAKKVKWVKIELSNFDHS